MTAVPPDDSRREFYHPGMRNLSRENDVPRDDGTRHREGPRDVGAREEGLREFDDLQPVERPLGQPAPSGTQQNWQGSAGDGENAHAVPHSSLSRGEATLPTSELRARRQAEAVNGDKVSFRLLWLFAILALFVLVRFNLGPIIEEVQYALARGTQRAEAEQARADLTTNLAETSEAFHLIYQSVGPSVVHIDVRSRLAGNRSSRAFTAGQGSGVILDKSGYILTNYHVIEGAMSIAVKLSDGRTITNAQVVGEDEPTDLAVLKIEAEGLIASPWGNSEELQVGDWVVAVGNPFGLDRSVTAGIVSAKRRDGVVRNMTYQSFLQTDAAVNPGNSGGPLVNLRGEVIGITTAIVGENYQGISLAIPSEIAKDIYERLREKGSIRRGWLGIAMGSVSPEEAAEAQVTSGVRVLSIVGQPAIDAGLEVGDIITSWNDRPVKDEQELMMRVAQTDVDSRANLEIRRGQETKKLQVTVSERVDFN